MLKQKAINLRRRGFSYNEINKRLGVAKGTLSFWFKSMAGNNKIADINISKTKKIWASNITKYNKRRSLLAREKWVEIQKSAEKDVAKMRADILAMVGIALYWAEGYKRGSWNVVFTNADANMHRVMMRFFVEICSIPKNKIRAQIQAHDNITNKKSLSYWSRVTGLSKSQFYKIERPKNVSSKNRRSNNLPYGTLRIKINSVVLTNKIKGWINGLSKEITGYGSIG